MNMNKFTLDHVGVVTGDIETTARVYIKMGYEQSNVVTDIIQQVKICFLTNGESKIELVEPLTEKSSVNKLLNKNGVSPYHLCYEVDDIEMVYDEMIEAGFIPLFRPVEAIAFNNRLICYLYHQAIGYIELVNK